jgi:hypothetical protein
VLKIVYLSLPSSLSLSLGNGDRYPSLETERAREIKTERESTTLPVPGYKQYKQSRLNILLLIAL